MRKGAAWALSVGAIVALTASYALAQAAGEANPPHVGEESVLTLIMQMVSNLFNSRELLNILKRPELTVTAFIVLNLIVFVETGLLIFCLPGDSLLVTAGVACYLAEWNLFLLLGTLCLAAILGDSVGYAIGLRTGPKIFSREGSWLFKKEHLLQAHAFYEKHGGKTIILARFMPIIRTFAPVVAGAGHMPYRRFITYSFFGAGAWITSMLLLGYFIPDLIDPLLRPVFGQDFRVAKHVEKVILVVIAVSVLPIVWKSWKGYRTRKTTSPIPAKATT